MYLFFVVLLTFLHFQNKLKDNLLIYYSEEGVINMNEIITMMIFLGIVFTTVGSAGSIIILSMYFITYLKEKCKQKKSDELLCDVSQMDEFVQL